ncbi:ChbG/HpnK family deacetylase [Bacteroides sp.]|uniref:ChbG/HpnK family deacetylase n=1 Tax=Bacteroides sp. TaxID=29523 RepID=UPI003AB80049
MKKLYMLFLVSFVFCSVNAQKINLIVRADDMGSFHAANEACLDGSKNGIIKSIEVMACCSWLPEAIQMLCVVDTTVDVGVHLMLTSEWIGVKWRPLTNAPSLVDENGYFYPFLTPRNDLEVNYPCLINQKWDIKEIEAEFRAQIELVKKNVPRLSHISTHMGSNRLSEEVAQMTERVAKEYGLYINMDNVKRLDTHINISDTDEVWEEKFIHAIDNMTEGTYLFVEHPAYNTQEMETVGHIGYMNVGEHRQKVINLFLSKKVQDVLNKKQINLISYADWKNMNL